MALRKNSRTLAIASLATGALALAPLSHAPAAAQEQQRSGDDFGLRGSNAPGGQQLSPLKKRRDSDRNPSGQGLVSAPPPPASYSAGAGDVAPDAAINYAKPRKATRLPKAYPPPPRDGKDALPPLEPYKTSYAGKKKAKARPADDQPVVRRLPPTGVAVVPTIAAKTPKKPEDKPYEPLGIDVGSLRLKPYVEGSFGYDTNPNRVTSPSKGSTLGRIDGGLAIESQWAQHSLKGEMRGGYSDYLGVKGANRPDGAGKIDGRIDVTRDTSLDYGGNFNITTIRQGSPEIPSSSSGATSTNQPISWNVGGYAGATHKFNRLEVSLRGTIDRGETGDATFSDGSVQKLHLNNYTTLGLKPRISYEISPAFKPFVEATIDKRTYDSTTDVNNYMRNSNGRAIRAGASFEIDGKLKGEASGGYVERDYQDPRLVKLRGPTFDASLIWTASPLTTVTLRGSTTANETTIPNASGAIARKASVEISHELLRNLKISGLASYQVTSYQGQNLSTAYTGSSTGINERVVNATVKAEYSLTRTVVVKASYTYERLKTTVPGSDYTSNIFLLGLRLQR